MRWYGYGYVYPFVELGFGLSMLMGYETRELFVAEFLVMAFSGLGVARKSLRKSASNAPVSELSSRCL